MRRALAVKHILIVDDEPDVLHALGSLLAQRENVRVTPARRATVARAVLMREQVDLVITDARMPGENGVSLAEAAAELGIPTIVMTGDSAWAIAHGAKTESLIEKPLDVAAMWSRIDECIARKR
jgi:DNA-binding NtrC family response regulator